MPTVPTTGDPESESEFLANPPGARRTNQSGPVDMIAKHAQRAGLDPTWLRKIMRVESGGRARETTGSYKGLFQLSQKEFTRHGGTGDIYDPEQNTMAAANKIAQEKLRFEQKHGRPATLKDIYMVHQQGEAGYDAHMANPDKPAWENMASTGEGKEKGPNWAKKAIWWNMSAAEQSKYGPPGKENWKYAENVKAKDFLDYWGGKIEGAKEGPISTAIGKARARREGIPEDTGKTKKEPMEDLGPGFEPARVAHINVESPDIRTGGVVRAPILPRAGRVPS